MRQQWAEIVEQRSSDQDQEALAKLCEKTAETAAEDAHDSETETEQNSVEETSHTKDTDENEVVLFDFEQHHDDVASKAIEMVQSRRATFKKSHVDTAVAQELRGFVFADDQARDTAHEQMVEHVMESIALCLTPDEVLDLPKALQRWDGKGVDRLFNCEVYTTAEQLRRERKVIEATKDPLALFVSEREIAAELKRFERKNGFSLNPGQASMVQHFLTSGTAEECAGDAWAVRTRHCDHRWAKARGEVYRNVVHGVGRFGHERHCLTIITADTTSPPVGPTNRG